MIPEQRTARWSDGWRLRLAFMLTPALMAAAIGSWPHFALPAANADAEPGPGNGRPAGERAVFDDIPFRWCPPGTYTQGFISMSERLYRDLRPEFYSDELPAREVAFETGFWLGEAPVTRRQWFIVTGKSPWPTDGPLGDELDAPVTHVTWEEARAFCESLSESTGRTYRLPTESEWEYAARAGTTTAFYFGDGHEPIDTHAWNWGNSTRVNEDHVRPVGRMPANPWGFHDIIGNVWELCSDLYGPYGGPGLPGLRAARGGSYRDYAPYLRSSVRSGIPETARAENVGFRILLEP